MVPAGGRPWRAKTTWRCEQAGGAWGPGGGAWRARRSAPRGRVRSRSVSSKAAGHVVCRCPELGSTPASVCICVRAVRRACLCRCTAAPLVRGGCVPGPPVDARNRGQRQTPRALGPAVHVRVGHRTRGTATTSDHAMSSRDKLRGVVPCRTAAHGAVCPARTHWTAGRSVPGASRCSEEPTI